MVPKNLQPNRLVATVLIFILTISPVLPSINPLQLLGALSGQAATIAWDGEAGDGKWSNPINWHGDHLPSEIDIAQFSAELPAPAIIDTNAVIGGIDLTESFVGQLAMKPGVQLFVGALGIKQSGGRFKATTNDIITTGSLIVDGGEFVAPANEMHIKGDISIASPEQFKHNAGSVVAYGNQQVITGSITFNHFQKISNEDDTLFVSHGSTLTFTGDLELQGDEASELLVHSTDASEAASLLALGKTDLTYVGITNIINAGDTPITCTFCRAPNLEIDGWDLVNPIGNDIENPTGPEPTPTQTLPLLTVQEITEQVNNIAGTLAIAPGAISPDTDEANSEDDVITISGTPSDTDATVEFSANEIPAFTISIDDSNDELSVTPVLLTEDDLTAASPPIILEQAAGETSLDQSVDTIPGDSPEQSPTNTPPATPSLETTSLPQPQGEPNPSSPIKEPVTDKPLSMIGEWVRTHLLHIPTTFASIDPVSDEAIRVASITDANGNLTPAQPVVSVVNGQTIVSVPDPNTFGRPGLFTLHVEVEHDGTTTSHTQSFSWGVLAVNFAQSSYVPNDTVEAAIGVVDDRGRTICDASISMTVTAPSGKQQFLSTGTGQIHHSDECGPITVTNTPDYDGSFTVSEVGTYQVHTITTTVNGSHKVESEIIVNDDQPFVVTRETSSRIWPGAAYTVTTTIASANGFAGTVQDSYPTSFTVLDISNDGQADSDSISWAVDIAAGEELVLNYTYQPPSVSPARYLLGPLTLGDWTEPRAWQIAADATFNDAATGDWDDGATWGNTSPGVEGTDYPGTSDIVTINSHTVTLTADQSAHDITLATGGTLSASSYTLDVSGSWTDTGGTFTEGTSTVHFTSSENETITSNGDDFNNVIINNGLAGYWKFDEGTGTNAADSSGYGNDGTLTSGPTWSASPTNSILFTNPYALNFDGTDDYVDMNDVAAYDLGDTADLTIAGWFNRDTATTDDTLVSKRAGITAGDTGYILYLDDADDKLYFEISDGTDEYQLASTSTFTSTGWTHFTVVWDQDSAANSEIYIDGVDDDATDTGTIGNIGDASNAVDFRLAIESDDGNPLDGSLDDVRVYAATATATEAGALGSGRFLEPSSLAPVVHWKFDDGTGSSATDSSGNGYTATLNSMEAADWESSDKPSLDFSNPYSINFDDNPEYITVPDISSEFSDEATLSMWIRNDAATPSSYDTGFLDLSSYGVTSHYPWTDNYLYLNTFRNSRVQTSSSNVGFDKSAWHHLAITTKPGDDNYIVYQNGSVVETFEGESSISIGTSGTLGRSSSTYWFVGKNDDVRLYNTSLTAAQISTLAGGNELGANIYTLNTDLDVNGNITFHTASVDASASNCTSASCDITVAGDWTRYNDGAEFTKQTGTVTLDGTDQSVVGSNDFYNLSKTEGANDSTNETVTFDAGATTTVSNTLTLDGRDSDDLISLDTTTGGTEHIFDVTSGDQVADYLSVKDQYASSNDITCTNCTNVSGNDDGDSTPFWIFEATEVRNRLLLMLSQ